jgi:hypothetical protein
MRNCSLYLKFDLLTIKLIPKGLLDLLFIPFNADRNSSEVLKFNAGIAPLIPEFSASKIIFSLETRNMGAKMIGKSIPNSEHKLILD